MNHEGGGEQLIAYFLNDISQCEHNKIIAGQIIKIFFNNPLSEILIMRTLKNNFFG